MNSHSAACHSVTIWAGSLRGSQDLQSHSKSTTLNHPSFPSWPPTFLLPKNYTHPYALLKTFTSGCCNLWGPPYTQKTSSNSIAPQTQWITNRQILNHSNWQSRSKVTQTSCCIAADESDFFGSSSSRRISRGRSVCRKNGLVIKIYSLQWEIMGIKGPCISYCLP